MTSVKTLIISRTIQFLAKALVIFLTMIVFILAVIRFSPQTLLYVANYFSPFEVIAERVDTEFLPLTFKFRNILIREDNDQRLAHLQALKLSADWIGAIRGRHNFWDIELSDGLIDLRKLPDQESATTSQEEVEPTPRLDLHRLISTLSARVSNVKLIVNDSAYVDLQKIESFSNGTENTIASDLIQSIGMQFVYSIDETPLVIDANMESIRNDGFTNIKLILAEVDLSPIAELTSSVSKKDNSSTQGNSRPIEQAMDWAWLQMIDATKITLLVEKLNYPGVDARSISSELVLNNDINFDISSGLSLDISDAFKFRDSFNLSGKLAPIDEITIGADLNGYINFKTPKIDLQTKGSFNLNGQFENNLKVSFSAASIPIETIPATSSESLLAKFFPIDAGFDLQSNSPKVDLSNINIRMGESDLSGTLNLALAENQPIKIVGELRSDKLSFQPIAQVQDDAESETSETRNKSKFFNDSVIDWSWLDNKDVDLLVSIKELAYSKYQLLDLHLPVSLNQGQLNIAGLSALFAGGAWDSSISIQKLDEGITLSLESDLRNATLEAMNFIPSDQITQGDTNLSTRLRSSGATSKQLAEALEGKLLLDIREGRIANDYFEIIGSDLFSELLSKLNPFVKSDPTTELKCMVANLKFNEGEIQVDKSLALATSKISVVADGNIDLGSEEINLKIVPRTENGIGLGIGTLVKSVSLGGSLANPAPHVTAGDLLKSGLALGAAFTTGGTSLLADGVFSKAVGANACKRAEKAFTAEAEELDAIEQAEELEREKLIEQQKVLETSTEISPEKE